MIGEQIFSQHFEDSQTFPTESVKIKTDNFPEGKSLFRMRIDGAESFLVTEQDPDNPKYKKYIGPEIDVFI